MPLLKLMLILEREDWGLARRLCMGTRNIYVFLQISKNIEGLFTLVKFVYPWSAVLIQNMLLVLLRMRPIFENWGWGRRERLFLGLGMCCFRFPTVLKAFSHWLHFFIPDQHVLRICCWCCWGWFWKEKIEDEGGDRGCVSGLNICLPNPTMMDRQECHSWENGMGTHLTQS